MADPYIIEVQCEVAVKGGSFYRWIYPDGIRSRWYGPYQDKTAAGNAALDAAERECIDVIGWKDHLPVAVK